MTTDLNPYEPSRLPEETIVLVPPLGFDRRLGGVILFGIHAAVGAGVIAYALFFIALSLPFAKYLGFRSDFEFLWLFGGTSLAVVSGFLVGIARVMSSGASPRIRRWAGTFGCSVPTSVLLILACLFSLNELLSSAVAIIIIVLANLWADVPSRLLFPSFHSRYSAHRFNEKTANLDQQCRRSLWLSMAGFLVPSALMVLFMFGVIGVHWDSIIVPLGTLFLGLIHFLLATGFSIYCRCKQRDWRASLATLIAICSLPYWIFTAWYMAMFGLGRVG